MVGALNLVVAEISYLLSFREFKQKLFTKKLTMMMANLLTTEHYLSIAGRQGKTYVNVLKLESVKRSPLTLQNGYKGVVNEGHSVSILQPALIGKILDTFLQC